MIGSLHLISSQIQSLLLQVKFSLFLLAPSEWSLVHASLFNSATSESKWSNPNDPASAYSPGFISSSLSSRRCTSALMHIRQQNRRSRRQLPSAMTLTFPFPSRPQSFSALSSCSASFRSTSTIGPCYTSPIGTKSAAVAEIGGALALRESAGNSSTHSRSSCIRQSKTWRSEKERWNAQCAWASSKTTRPSDWYQNATTYFTPSVSTPG